MNENSQPLVGIIMGSKSDWETMRHAVETLQELGVPHEVRVVSAHRTPDQMFAYAETAAERGIEVIIAGAGGAAHLPGMTAAKTSLPVLGVPVQSRALNGMDSLLSIVQMPAGVPVGTLAIGRAGAVNAALLATAILGNKHPQFRSAYRRIPAAADWRRTGPPRSARVRMTVGILGGGQLGRMLALAGYPLGLRFRVLDTYHDAPAGELAELVVGESFDDREALARFASGLTLVTYEFENVPVDAARYLESQVPVYPPPAALEASQDRLTEKAFFRQLNIPYARLQCGRFPRNA